jgi:hypothetical protein
LHPRSGLERSDFVRWPGAWVAGHNKTVAIGVGPDTAPVPSIRCR